MKTKRDLFKEIYEKYGIQTTAAFHCDLNQEMTDEQYQKELEAWICYCTRFRRNYCRW